MTVLGPSLLSLHVSKIAILRLLFSRNDEAEYWLTGESISKIAHSHDVSIDGLLHTWIVMDQ